MFCHSSHDRNGIITVWNFNDLEPTAEETFAICQFGFCPVSVVQEGNGCFYKVVNVSY